MTNVKRTFRYMVGAGMGLLSSSAMAADPGWSVQFYYDAFEDRIYPMAYMQEQTDGITYGAASLFMACHAGAPAMFFQSGGISFDSAPIAAKFRGADGAQEIEFAAAEVPPFDRQRVADDSAALISIFASASGLVPFQTDDKTGNFPSAGFAKVQTIMASECATL